MNTKSLLLATIAVVSPFFAQAMDRHEPMYMRQVKMSKDEGMSELRRHLHLPYNDYKFTPHIIRLCEKNFNQDCKFIASHLAQAFDHTQQNLPIRSLDGQIRSLQSEVKSLKSSLSKVDNPTFSKPLENDIHELEKQIKSKEEQKAQLTVYPAYLDILPQEEKEKIAHSVYAILKKYGKQDNFACEMNRVETALKK